MLLNVILNVYRSRNITYYDHKTIIDTHTLFRHKLFMLHGKNRKKKFINHKSRFNKIYDESILLCNSRLCKTHQRS